MNHKLNQRSTMNPTDINRPRSTFKMRPRHLTTFNAGELVPIFCRTYYPGDTVTIDTSAFVRMATSIHPTMDDAYLDVYFFAVPRRLVQDHWINFMGENTESAYVSPVEYNLPYLRCGSEGFEYGSIADHLGIPPGVPNISVEASQIRAYCLTWNYWFRDQNLMDPCVVSLDDQTRDVDYDRTHYNYRNSAELGGRLLPVSKFHDYFTSALLQPQKGDAVTIPMLGDAPVYGDGNLILQNYDNTNSFGIVVAGSGGDLSLENPMSGILASSYLQLASKEGVVNSQLFNPQYSHSDSPVYADLSSAVSATINDLRLAFATQQMLELDSIGGSRYPEIIRAHFGVSSPDARQQRPEYLSGKRIKIGMQQVLQTSATVDGVSPQGNVAGMSLTSDVSKSFTKSFTEHTILLGMCCVRTKNTYQFGIPLEFSRKDRLDFVWPSLYHIGNLPIYNREIFATGTEVDDQVFGFKEAWAELRDMPNTITGDFRSSSPRSLDVWHYAEDYLTTPRLDENFIRQSSVPVSRTLAVSTELQDQFLADFQFDITYVSELTQNSMPGLRIL